MRRVLGTISLDNGRQLGGGSLLVLQGHRDYGDHLNRQSQYST